MEVNLFQNIPAVFDEMFNAHQLVARLSIVPLDHRHPNREHKIMTIASNARWLT